jgi:hypothetical protein
MSEEHIEVAVGDEGVERLRQQASRLDAARHPGVVELLGFSASDGVAELRCVSLAGGALAEYGPMTAEEAAGVAAALATTLADLHSRGVVHGALAPDCVLLTGDGRPVLCGFATGGLDILSPADDIAALGELVSNMVDDGPLAELARWSLDPDPERRPSAAAFAAAIQGRVPGARLPGTAATSAAPPPSLAQLLRPTAARRRRSLPPRAIGAVVALAVAGAALVAVRSTSGASQEGTPTTSVAPTTSTLRTSTTAVAPVQVWPAREDPVPTVVVGERRWEVGRPGDVLATAAWACGDVATLALLRPATGDVWTFPSWAEPGRDVTGVPAGRVEGGRAVEASDTDGDGCLELVVRRDTGQPVVVRVQAAQ